MNYVVLPFLILGRVDNLVECYIGSKAIRPDVAVHMISFPLSSSAYFSHFNVKNEKQKEENKKHPGKIPTSSPIFPTSSVDES